MNKSTTNKNITKKIIVFIVFCAVLIIIDQLTKAIAVNTLADGNFVIIKDFLYFELIYNNGAAFGILGNARIFFCIITIIFCLFIEILYIKLSDKKEYIPLKIISMTLFAGACGNLIDRIKSGRVVDFIAFDFGSYGFPRFNCADIYVTLSVAALLVMILFVYDDNQLKEAVRGE